MEKLKTIFKGDSTDKSTYFFGIKEEKGRLCLHVYRNFKGDTNNSDLIPSGWWVEQVLGNSTLCIDGGTNWYVYPTPEAWQEVESFIFNKNCKK